MPKFESTLFTSIPPRIRRPVQGRDFGPAWQTACVKSWVDAGFRVVSLNAPEEIEALRSLARTVEFKEIPEGRTRPLFTDFFTAARSSGSKIVGIINADCMMIPQIGFAKHLIDQVSGIVIAERLNLSKKTLRPTGISCYGFDAFFFEVAALANVERDDHWRIGGVWCDFWLPLAFLVAGFEIKTLPAPILLHLDHDTAWEGSSWESHFIRLIDLLRAHGGGRLDPNLLKKLLSAQKVGRYEVGELSQQLFVWLKSREPLWTPEVGSMDDLMTTGLNAVATPPQVNPYRALLQFEIGRIWDNVVFCLHRTRKMLGLPSPFSD